MKNECRTLSFSTPSVRFLFVTENLPYLGAALRQRLDTPNMSGHLL